MSKKIKVAYLKTPKNNAKNNSTYFSSLILHKNCLSHSLIHPI